jgi:opacity protein-like surface antigen
MKTLKRLLLFYLLAFSLSSAHAADSTTDKFRYPFYLGVTGGYGSTTWEGLVPTQNNQNAALIISTPTYIEEGGAVWGFFGGYEFLPNFALEGGYLRYPNASVYFSSRSLYSFQNNGQTVLNTHTEELSLVAKIMLFIPHTQVRAYSSFGAAGVHRYDQLADIWRLSPTFGAGLNYNFTPRIMAEIGGSYTGGYGKSELNPAQDYLPFLLSAFLRLAYRF